MEIRLVGIPGFEPGMTGPESVVLPLHHIPRCVLSADSFLNTCAKILLFPETTNFFSEFFSDLL